MYELYVSMASPYSLKAAAMVGYVGLECELVRLNLVNRYQVLRKLTGKTMVPVLRDGSWAINDSTHIARFLMDQSDRPTLPRSGWNEPLCWIIEEFADEWMSRWMLYSRWFHERDRREAQALIGQELTGGAPGLAGVVGRRASAMIRSRLEQGGMSLANEEALENSQERSLQVLERLFTRGPAYLFEGYPTVADFGLFGPLSQFAADYTGRRILRKMPALRAYTERLHAMVPPLAHVEVRREASRPVAQLQPLFAEFLGTYWPVLVANFRAMAGPRPPRQARALLVDGTTFSFQPSAYMVARFKELLTMLDRAYEHRDHLFGEEGMRLESALMSQVAHLTHHLEGRQLLRDFHHLGMH